MAVRTLTNQEYINLMAKILVDHPVLPDHIIRIKQVHRLLASGHKAEDLTPVEQAYTKAFHGLKLVQIPNDYGWEPGIEIEVEIKSETKPKKHEK